MKYFITSDLHLGHSNIIKYCNRPFNDINHMDNELIRRWNERINSQDQVFVVGDFCFRNSPGGKEGEGLIYKADYYKQKLNGNIIFIKGNHDKNNSTKTLIERMTINYANYRFNLVHDPDNASFDYSINLTGHVHEKWAIQEYTNKNKKTCCINVGVDVWKFYPVTLDEVISRYQKWQNQK